MVKKQCEIPAQVSTNFKEGIGDVTLLHFLTEQEALGTGRLFAKTLIEPGNSIGEHTHQGDMEVYYILSGKALVYDNGTDVVLESGDCHICPDGSSHSIQNVGDNTLEYIAIILYTKQKEV